MPNLDALKTRVERAERNLDAARAARDAESRSLVEMWRQIRTRYETQEREIEAYRARVAALEDAHDEMVGMVEALLEAVETTAGRAGDDTVPKITGHAEALLEGRPVADEWSDLPAPAEADAAPPDVEVREPRARPDIRDLVSRVTEARRAALPEAETETRELEDIRAELEQIGERMNARAAGGR
jgi:predicted  nucleic acid-binding Zn-ribbon protein